MLGLGFCWGVFVVYGKPSYTKRDGIVTTVKFSDSWSRRLVGLGCWDFR